MSIMRSMQRLLRAMTLAGLAGWLNGCATVSSAGGVATSHNVPFVLVSGGKSLLIEPGALSVELSERPSLPFSSSRITIRSRRGEMTVDLRQEDFAGDSVTVRGATHDLSADLVVTWSDRSEGTYRQEQSASCTYSGWCSKPVQVTRCPGASYIDGSKGSRQNRGNPECRRVTEDQHGYHHDCPGTRRVLVTSERYRRQHTIDFLDPGPGTRKLGQYQGQSATLSRQVAQQDLEPCH